MFRALFLGVCLFAFFLAGCSSVRPLRKDKSGFLDLLGEPKQKAQDSSVAALDPTPQRLPASALALNLRWPVSQVQVTSHFGKRRDGFHEGVDLKASVGTPVYASGAGQVIYSGSRIRGYGRMVVIQHAEKVATVYAHNSKVLVKKGQKIKQGQLIAYSGQTGQARGPHVHFEIRHGVSAVNPMQWMQAQARN